MIDRIKISLIGSQSLETAPFSPHDVAINSDVSGDDGSSASDDEVHSSSPTYVAMSFEALF
jgi:hypothetical protein